MLSISSVRMTCGKTISLLFSVHYYQASIDLFNFCFSTIRVCRGLGWVGSQF